MCYYSLQLHPIIEVKDQNWPVLNKGSKQEG